MNTTHRRRSFLFFPLTTKTSSVCYSRRRHNIIIVVPIVRVYVTHTFVPVPNEHKCILYTYRRP
jgi:hypothetical protein